MHACPTQQATAQAVASSILTGRFGRSRSAAEQASCGDVECSGYCCLDGPIELTLQTVRCLLWLFDKWIDLVMTQSNMRYRVAVRAAVNDDVAEKTVRSEEHRLRYM